MNIAMTKLPSHILETSYELSSVANTLHLFVHVFLLSINQ